MSSVASDEGDVVVVAESDDEGSASASSEESASAAAEGELPPTGGASVLALGAGVLLVAWWPAGSFGNQLTERL